MPVKKIKIGKEYRVRSDLVVDKKCGGLTALDCHMNKAGEIITFNKVDGRDGSFNGIWFSPEMLEKVKTKKSKWEPIETVPLGIMVTVWNDRDGYATDYWSEDEACKSVLLTSLKYYTHWRPMIKGPKE